MTIPAAREAEESLERVPRGRSSQNSFPSSADITNDGCDPAATTAEIKAAYYYLARSIIRPTIRRTAVICAPTRSAVCVDTQAYETLSQPGRVRLMTTESEGDGLHKPTLRANCALTIPEPVSSDLASLTTSAPRPATSRHQRPTGSVDSSSRFTPNRPEAMRPD